MLHRRRSFIAWPGLRSSADDDFLDVCKSCACFFNKLDVRLTGLDEMANTKQRPMPHVSRGGSSDAWMWP